MKDKVSIIIPVYNQKNYLLETLKSVVDQSYKNIEVIVVDDGSEEDLGGIVKSLQDSKIKYIRLPRNFGTPHAINIGILNSSGNFIGIIGGDDLMRNDNVEKKLDLIKKYKNVGAVHGNVEFMDEKGNFLGYLDPPSFYFFVYNPFKKLLFENFISAPSVLVKRECYEKVGLYDERLKRGEDWHMWLRIARFFDFVYQGEPLVKYRVYFPQYKKETFTKDLDLQYMKILVEDIFDRFQLEKEGYSREDIYYSNYFRMLHQKIRFQTKREILSLYWRGIKNYPKYLFKRSNYILLAKLLLAFLLTEKQYSYLRKKRYELMGKKSFKLFKHAYD